MSCHAHYNASCMIYSCHKKFRHNAYSKVSLIGYCLYRNLDIMKIQLLEPTSNKRHEKKISTKFRFTVIISLKKKVYCNNHIYVGGLL